MTSTGTTPATRPSAGGLRMSDTHPRFRDLVAAEWIKHVSLRSTWIAYGVTALTVIAFNAGIAYDTYSNWTLQVAADRAAFVRDGLPLGMAFTANAALIMALALGAIGALVIVGEYSTGTIRTTFAAVPPRRSVMAAKVVVVTAFTTVFGMLVAGVSFALTQGILDRRGVGLSLGDPGTWRVVWASALLAPVCALAGLALGTVIRHTAATMIASMAVLLVLPVILTDGRYWPAVAGHTLPYRAWLRLVAVEPTPTLFPWSAGGAWTVYAVWALAAAALAINGVQRRDL